MSTGVCSLAPSKCFIYDPLCWTSLSVKCSAHWQHTGVSIILLLSLCVSWWHGILKVWRVHENRAVIIIINVIQQWCEGLVQAAVPGDVTVAGGI